MLRPYQQDAADAVVASLPRCRPLVVAPTGSGKSHIIAEIVRQVWPTKTLILQHRSELVEQNAEKVAAIIGADKVGVYASKLGLRQAAKPVVCAMIQSCWRWPLVFQNRGLIIVDEAHLVPTDAEQSDGMYAKFLAALPKAHVCGLTATPHRLSGGPIARHGNMLDTIVYDIGVFELVAEGFLAPLVGKHSKATVDMGGVKHRGGEFVQPEMAAKFEGVVGKCVLDMLRHTEPCRSVLIFASSVKHAMMIHDLVPGSRIVTGKTPTDERAQIVADFRDRRLRYVVNVDCLTTGFDAPCVDCIALMRATESPALYTQMAGRGMRLYEGKSHCLVLDYGGNILRHGAIDAMVWPDVDVQEKSDAPPPLRICPLCDEIGPPRPVCRCGFVFPVKERNSHEKLRQSACGEAPMLFGAASGGTERHPVEKMIVNVHTRPSGPPCLRVRYVVPGASHLTFLFPAWEPEKPWASKNFVRWFDEHCSSEGYAPPRSAHDVVARPYLLQAPTHITVVPKPSGFPKITTYFDGPSPPVVIGEATAQAEPVATGA